MSGQLHYLVAGFGRNAVTIVEGDTDGDRLADFQIGLVGSHLLSTGDFYL
jgi:hypothetical protein